MSATKTEKQPVHVISFTEVVLIPQGAFVTLSLHICRAKKLKEVY